MATYQPRDGRITATVRITPHPSQSKTFDTKRDAKAWAMALEVQLRAEKKQDFAHKTLGEALEKYRDEECIKHRGAKNDINRVNRLMTEVNLDQSIVDADKAMWAKWKNARLEVVKPSSVERDMNLISAFYNWLISELGWLKENPIKDVTRPPATPHRERVIEQAEVDAVIKQLNHVEGEPPITIGRQLAVMFLLALETGMRSSELCNLTWDRAKLDKKFVYLDTTKNGRPREVPLSPKAIELIKSMYGINDGKIFMLDPNTRDAYFRKAVKQAGLSGFTFHDSRHTAATWLAQSGKIDVLNLCKMFGWTDIKKALVYFNPTTTSIADLL